MNYGLDMELLAIMYYHVFHTLGASGLVGKKM